MLLTREYTLLTHKQMSTVLQMAHRKDLWAENCAGGSHVSKRNTCGLEENFQIIAQTTRFGQNNFSMSFEHRKSSDNFGV